MMSKAIFCIALVLVMVVGFNAGFPAGKERVINEFDFQPVDDYGTMDTALINYLFKKQLVKRLRSQMDTGDLQRKRFYWKHCAFNAVSCFGQ